MYFPYNFVSILAIHSSSFPLSWMHVTPSFSECEYPLEKLKKCFKCSCNEHWFVAYYQYGFFSFQSIHMLLFLSATIYPLTLLPLFVWGILMLKLLSAHSHSGPFCEQIWMCVYCVLSQILQLLQLPFLIETYELCLQKVLHQNHSQPIFL